jgi:uncharacterized protein (TIGR02722 family)
MGLLGLVLAGCAPRITSRMDPDTSHQIEVGLNSQDFRSVAQTMTRSMIQCAPIARAANAPTIAFFSVKNNTSELINTAMFLDRMRSEMVRFAQGRVRFLDRDLSEAIQHENQAKRQGRVTSSASKDVLGADFFLTGQIDDIGTTAGAARVKYWRLSFRLTDAASSEVVWQDDYEVKKFERRGIGE